MSNFTGKVAIITGAASGQGAAEARLFAEAGARVIVADIDEKGWDVAAAIGENALFQHHDTGSRESWEGLMALVRERFGRLDVLINNAAVYKPRSLLETDEALWDLHYRVNQYGPYIGMKMAAEQMRENGGGVIINTSSVAGLGAYPNQFAYAASKWALRGMSRLAAAELGPLDIRVNGIFPGMIDTPMLAENAPGAIEAYAKAIPLGRAGTPEEVARLALFLASDEASYLSGAEIIVSGGAS